MPAEKKEILPDIAKRMSLDRFFATQRDVVNDELESLVPDLIEDALENPTGSYQRATKSQMYQLTTINKTTKDIKKDTTEIIRFLNDDLMSKLDEIQEAAEAAGDGLMDNMFDMMDMFDLDGPDRRKNRKNRRSRRPRGPKGGRGLRGLAGRAMTSIGNFFRGPSKTPLPTQMQPPKATAVLEDTKLKNYKYDPSIDRNRYTSGPDKGKLAPFDEADKLARKTPTATPKTSGVPKITVPPVAEVPKSFLSRMMSGAGNAVSSVTSGTVNMVKGVGRFAMKAGGKIAMPVLAGMAIWSAWKQIGELPKPPVVTQEQYTTMISDIIGKTVAEFGLMAVGAVVGFLVGLPFAGVGAVPGAIAGILGGLGADYVWGDDIQAMANNPVYKELINKIVNYFMSEDSADADKKRKEQTKEAKQTVNSISVTDPRKDLKPEQLAAKGLVPSLTSVGTGIGATSAIAMSLTPQNPLGSQMPVIPSMMPSSSGIDTTGLINPLSFFEDQTTPGPFTQADNKIRIPIESDTYKDMSNDELKALGLKRVGSETVDGQKVNVYQRIKATQQTGGAMPAMMPVASAGAPAGSPEARLVQIGQEQGLAKKEGGVTTTLLAHLMGAAGAAGAAGSGAGGGGGGAGGGGGSGSGGGTAEGPKVLTPEQQSFFDDLGKGAIDASSTRAAFLNDKTTEQLSQMGVQKVTQRDGTVMYQQAAVTDQQAIESLKAKAAAPQLDPNKATTAAERENIMMKAAVDAGITDPKELSQFMAQTSHESMGFKTMKEMGGDAYFKKYEGRKDLGNTEPGDGLKFKGRGFIQLTGRANYKHFGEKIGVDLVNNPELAETPEIASKLAIEYWKERVKPKVKDFGDTKKVTKLINGGQNGLQDRLNKVQEYNSKNLQGKIAEMQAQGPGLPGGKPAMSPEELANYKPTKEQVDQEKAAIEQRQKEARTQIAGTAQTATGKPGSKESPIPVDPNQVIADVAAGNLSPNDGVVQSAMSMLGANEHKDKQAIMKYLQSGGKGNGVDPAVTAWCSSFVNASLAKAGIQGTGSLAAGSWHNWGEGVNDPTQIKPGDVVVNNKISERTGMKGSHVEIATGPAYKNSKGQWVVPTIGGNTGKGTAEVAQQERVLGEGGNQYVARKALPEYYSQAVQPATAESVKQVDKVKQAAGTASATPFPDLAPSAQAQATAPSAAPPGATNMTKPQTPVAELQTQASISPDRTVPTPIPEPSVAEQIGDLKTQIADSSKPPPALVAPNQSPAAYIPTQTKPDLTSAAGRQVAYAAGVPMPPIGSGNAPFNAASFTMPGEFGMIS